MPAVGLLARVPARGGDEAACGQQALQRAQFDSSNCRRRSSHEKIPHKLAAAPPSRGLKTWSIKTCQSRLGPSRTWVSIKTWSIKDWAIKTWAIKGTCVHKTWSTKNADHLVSAAITSPHRPCPFWICRFLGYRYLALAAAKRAASRPI